MSGFIPLIALVLTASPTHAAPFFWKSTTLDRQHDVLVAALALEDGEVDAFRLMIAKRYTNVDEYLGGLISMASPTEQEEFARRFGVEDPVYGTPAQIRAQSPHQKALLMRLAMRGMSQLDLRRVRASGIDPTALQLQTLEVFIRLTRPPITADALFEVWRTITNDCPVHLTEA